MILHEPFIISAALAPGLRIGEGTLSLLSVEPERDGRDRARFELYTPEFTHIDEELRSGHYGFHSLVNAFEGFLAFLEAAGESLAHNGENASLFPPHVVEWAADHGDELAAARMSICDEDGNPNVELIEEN